MLSPVKLHRNYESSVVNYIVTVALMQESYVEWHYRSVIVV